MMLRGILQILPILITFESAYFLLKSNLYYRSQYFNKLISKLNRDYIKLDIAQQSANTQIGVLLLLSTVVFQIYNSFDYPTVSEMGNPPPGSLLISIILATLIFLGCRYLSKMFTNRILSKFDKKEK